MSVPPKMSAAHMFWWGMGLVAAHLAMGWVWLHVLQSPGPGPVKTLVQHASALIPLVGQLGVGLLVGSVIVAAVQARRSQEEAARERL